MAYTFRPVTFNPKAPTWMKVPLESNQAQSDMRHTDALDRFFMAARDWVTNETINRDNSPNPAAYVPNAFNFPVPMREIWDGTAQGAFVTTFENDPPVSAPTLPAFVAPHPPDVIGTDVGDRDAADDQFKANVMTILWAIKTKLGA